MVKTTNYNGVNFNVIDYKGEWYFIAKEVSDYLEYSSTEIMLRNVDKEEIYQLKKKEVADFESGEHQTIGFVGKVSRIGLITEDGLYQAIFNSRKTEAKQFRKWVTSTIKLLREKSGLEAFQAFRMMDKEIQKQCHSFIVEQGVLGDKADCIVMNKNVNEITSGMYDINPPIKKGDMEKVYPEMLVDRQKIQNDYCVLFGYTKSHKQSKELIKNKVVGF